MKRATKVEEKKTDVTATGVTPTGSAKKAKLMTTDGKVV